MHPDDTYEEDLTTLLGIALDRLGGHLELTADEVEAVKAKYGMPAPILVARIDGGLLGHICTVEQVPEEQWPHLQRAMGCDEAEARATANAIAAAIMARRAMRDALQARATAHAEAHAAKHRDGMN